MTTKFVPQQGSCECHANTFNINAKPIGRFICHCTICQAFTGKSNNDVTILLSKDVNALNLEKTQFKRWKLPPNIRRGTCTQCNKPSIELGMAGSLVFIPTANYPHPEALPAPTVHLFYNRRVHDIKDGLPKYSGFVKSQAIIFWVILRGIYKRLTGQ